MGCISNGEGIENNRGLVAFWDLGFVILQSPAAGPVSQPSPTPQGSGAGESEPAYWSGRGGQIDRSRF